MQTYLWIEDAPNKAAYTFWKTFMKELFPDIIVESKKNCSRLIAAVQNIKDSENRYIIALDHAFDNDQVVRELTRLKMACRKRKNIYELDIISFEYLLLDFAKLIQWVYAEEDEFLVSRRHLIDLRENLLEAVASRYDYKDIDGLDDYIRSLDEYNIERLASKMLFDLTRNTGFEVRKGILGICWVSSCCSLPEREDDDLCGLDRERLSLGDKMKEMFEYTKLKKEFARLGLGGIVC